MATKKHEISNHNALLNLKAFIENIDEELYDMQGLASQPIEADGFNRCLRLIKDYLKEQPTI